MHWVRFFKTKSSSILTRLKSKQMRSLFILAKPLKNQKTKTFFAKNAPGRDIVKKTNRFFFVFTTFAPDRDINNKTNRVFSKKTNPGKKYVANKKIEIRTPPQIIPQNIDSTPQVNRPKSEIRIPNTRIFLWFQGVINDSICRCRDKPLRGLLSQRGRPQTLSPKVL